MSVFHLAVTHHSSTRRLMANRSIASSWPQRHHFSLLVVYSPPYHLPCPGERKVHGRWVRTRPAVEKNRWTVRRPGVNCLMFVTPGLSPPRRIQDSSDEERKMYPAAAYR